jgi:hypothetical protein
MCVYFKFQFHEIKVEKEKHQFHSMIFILEKFSKFSFFFLKEREFIGIYSRVEFYIQLHFIYLFGKNSPNV